MIKSIEYRGLHKRRTGVIEFEEDFTLLTGRNGSGKTAVIKLIWYLISGNIEKAVREINFDFVKVTTDTCSVSIESKGDGPDDKITVITKFRKEAGETRLVTNRLHWLSDENPLYRMSKEVALATGKSLFLPTFRRIEGGFSTSRDLFENRSVDRPGKELVAALDNYTAKMSVFDHRLIATLATDDLRRLLNEKIAEQSTVTNKFVRATYLNVKNRLLATKEISIKEDSSKKSKVLASKIDEILKLVDEVEAQRNESQQRYFKLGEITQKIFEHRGIELSRSFVIGDSVAAVDSDLLSAGEKQLLSFLCYNAFYENAVIIIDEPEISLHPDWQRRLISMLKDQNSTNQFIFTTHSPFIYSRYPEKEVCLSDDKGE